MRRFKFSLLSLFILTAIVAIFAWLVPKFIYVCLAERRDEQRLDEILGRVPPKEFALTNLEGSAILAIVILIYLAGIAWWGVCWLVSRSNKRPPPPPEGS